MYRLFTMLFISAMLVTSKSQASPADAEAVILSDAKDAYYSLAEEISETEDIPIYQTFEEAAAARPVYLLWVVSPQNLSEDALLDFSRSLAGLDSYISVGILSGKTIEDARSLWRGPALIAVQESAVVNGTKENKIEPQISYGSSGEKQIPLTKENLLQVLGQADAIQISMEGAAGSWFDESLGIIVKDTDLPPVKSVIIQHYGCSTFRPWADNSIALKSIQQGALAYCGFVYPSIAGTRFGDYHGNSLLNSWREFPVGHLVQIQNRAAMQSYAALPHFYMFGDPRIYTRDEMPYTPVRDEIEGDRRVIELKVAAAGVLPIYVRGGAEYEFVKVNGWAASTADDAFFNSRLQMMAINQDLYIAVEQAGGQLTIELQKKAPWHWGMTSYLTGFLDSLAVENQGSDFPLLVAVPVFILFLFKVMRKQVGSRDLAGGLVLGSVIALASLAYLLFRADDMTVTNIPVKVNWRVIFSIFLFSGCGAIFFRKARTLKGKGMAIVTANLSSLATLIIMGVGTLIKMSIIGDVPGVNKAGYPWVLPLFEFIAGCLLYTFVYGLFDGISKSLKRIAGNYRED